jgi:hypothetical protein
MGDIIERVDPILVALVLLVAMLGAWAVGWWRGRKAVPEPREDPGIKFTDAALSLLGLLLAFTFAMSLGRHDQRRQKVFAESNAIGDFYTCATLLKDPNRPRLQDISSRLQNVIREYTQRKLDAARGLRSGSNLEEEVRWFQIKHATMTTIVAEALVEGTPIAVPLTNTLNNVTSSHASRLAAYRERLPWSIVGLLVLGAIVPEFLMGLQQGSSAGPHLSGTLCFFLMVTLVTYVILDLNQPGSGAITVSQEPFERLLRSME